MNYHPGQLTKCLFSLIVCALVGMFMISPGALAASAYVRLDLFIELRAPEHVEPGGEYTVNLSYGNSNTARTPADTWVEATLPPGVQFVSAKDKHNNPLPPDSIDGSTLHWDVGTPIPDWETEHISILLAVDEGLSQNASLTVTAEIGTSAEEVTLDNNTASVTSYTCDMAGSFKQAQAHELMPLDVITYTITLSLAQGSSPGFRDVTLVDTLPPAQHTRFLGWTSTEQGTHDGGQLRWKGRVHASQPTRLQYQLGIEADVPHGTQLTNRAHLSWWDNDAGVDREFELDPVTVRVSLPDNARLIGPQGGQWQPAEGLTITVPPLAFQETTRFQFKPLFNDEPPDTTPPGWFLARHAFQLQAFRFGEVHQFDQPLEFAFQYGEGDLAGLLPGSLQLWYRAGPGSAWEMADQPTLYLPGLIKFTSDHLTEFGLFGRGAHQVVLPIALSE